MDPLSSSSSSFSLSVLAAAMVLLISLLIRRALATKATGAGGKLPPGPWNLPVIGSLHHLAGGAPPHRALRRLSRRHGPLMLLRLGEMAAVVVSSPEAAAEVMRAKDPVFASRPRGATLDVVGYGGKGLILAPYGEHWRRMRKLCVAELLGAGQVRRMARIRQAEVARLVESVDLSRGLIGLTNNVIARAAFGGECRRRREYLRELGVVARLAGGFSLPDMFPSSRLARWLSGAMRELRRSHARVQVIIGGIIQERQERRGASSGAAGMEEDEDLLDVLLRLQEEDSTGFPLTPEIIGAVIAVSPPKHHPTP
ncbi:hypothetical protein ACP4OV_012347 [Aristida adscensionis]